MSKLNQFRDMLEQLGYTFEHDWHEGHGDGGQLTFQAPRSDATLILSYNRDREPDQLYPGQNRDYRLAREIRADKDERYTRVRSTTSPCCTAGSDYFKDVFGEQYQIFGAAGHGEWATRLGHKDKPKEPPRCSRCGRPLD